MVHLALLALASFSVLGAQAAPVRSPSSASFENVETPSFPPQHVVPLRHVVKPKLLGQVSNRPKDRRQRNRITWENEHDPNSFRRSWTGASQLKAERKSRRPADVKQREQPRAQGVSPKRDAALSVTGVPGTVTVVGHSLANSSNSSAPTMITSPVASLVFALTPAASNASVLTGSASTTNHTTIYLVPAASPSNSSANSTSPSPLLSEGDVPVNLQMPFFDPLDASLVLYCATFDPSPASNASGVTAEPCGAPANNHTSQLFAYTPASGAVSPAWAAPAPVPSPVPVPALASNMTLSNTTLADAANNMGPGPMCHPLAHTLAAAFMTYGTNSSMNGTNSTTYGSNSTLTDNTAYVHNSSTNMTAPPAKTSTPAMFELVFTPDVSEFPVSAFPMPDMLAQALSTPTSTSTSVSTTTASMSTSPSTSTAPTSTDTTTPATPSSTSTSSTTSSSSASVTTGFVRAFFTPGSPLSAIPTPSAAPPTVLTSIAPVAAAASVITIDAFPPPAPSAASSASSAAPSPSDRR